MKSVIVSSNFAHPSPISAFRYFFHLTCYQESVCGGAVNTSKTGSGGPGFKPRPSRCFLRQGTLLHFVSLHPGVEMGTGDIPLEGNPAMD